MEGVYYEQYGTMCMIERILHRMKSDLFLKTFMLIFLSTI